MMRKNTGKATLCYLICLLYVACIPESIEFSNEVHVEPVDLGLSVKWAPCNVGATSPEEYGGYYAWGEIDEKSIYTWSTYKWCEGDWDNQIKYCTRGGVYGIKDNKTVLDSDDDVAYMKWGNKWRMPTMTEMDELLNKCTWSWTAVNGIKGYLVRGPNGNSIFLPASGVRGKDGVHSRGSYGHYWTVALNDHENNYAHCLTFSEEDYVRDLKSGRSVGISVRPVYEDSDEVDSNPDAVDLGLTVKWASCNVGADSPEEYGDYFAWGETTTKSNYAESNSVTFELSISQLESRGIIGADGNLTAAYDAATANWGDNWRMPTLGEMKELINKCECEWTTQNGVNGYKVTGPNGNSIFLPTARYHFEGSDHDMGYYWSATPYSGSYNAYYLYFGHGYYDWDGYGFRYDGRAVRPVSEE